MLVVRTDSREAVPMRLRPISTRNRTDLEPEIDRSRRARNQGKG
ncbi:hypothetical protein HMPREF1318_2474 [Actinomyces massiliensis F0489]|uniref:Uncharacterized protein n=1 Tax=Actinomyces massiliensis F0489 TaxID=1125718 RepID=J0N7G3_9ACTO|nr:hypothetical protein HMPREF1318_2474 [Actinomyces massiliensis F0489]